MLVGLADLLVDPAVPMEAHLADSVDLLADLLVDSAVPMEAHLADLLVEQEGLQVVLMGHLVE